MRAKRGFDYWPMRSTPKCSFELKNYSGETQRFSSSRNSFETFQGDCCEFRTRNADTSHVNCTTVPARPWLHLGMSLARLAEDAKRDPAQLAEDCQRCPRFGSAFDPRDTHDFISVAPAIAG